MVGGGVKDVGWDYVFSEVCASILARLRLKVSSNPGEPISDNIYENSLCYEAYQVEWYLGICVLMNDMG